jgi:hypothetical protein
VKRSQQGSREREFWVEPCNLYGKHVLASLICPLSNLLCIAHAYFSTVHESLCYDSTRSRNKTFVH